MNKLTMLTLIVPRENGDKWQVFLAEAGLPSMFSFPCLGTAGKTLRERLGLASNEKTLLMAAAPHGRIKPILGRAVSDMGLNLPGSGIAMAIPLESAGGQSSLNMLLGGQPFDPNEVNEMDFNVFPYSLVVCICENGWSDTVMDAARSAGAGGGTVIHAKGTAGELARKFMGVSLAAEKQMVLILLNQKTRRDVMRAVMEKAGVNTPAHTVLFSLPVEDIAGLKSIMDEETASAPAT